MDVKPQSLRQPTLHFGVLVDAVVVDPSQKAGGLQVPVPGLPLSDHRTGGHIQRGKQGNGDVSVAVVGDTLNVAQSHGQQRLRPVKSLNLHLLVYAEHESVLGWIEIQADDVANLLHKERWRACSHRLPRSGEVSAGAAGPRKVCSQR